MDIYYSQLKGSFLYIIYDIFVKFILFYNKYPSNENIEQKKVFGLFSPTIQFHIMQILVFIIFRCPAVDCEEFELPNPYDPYPFCCPVCSKFSIHFIFGT